MSQKYMFQTLVAVILIATLVGCAGGTPAPTESPKAPAAEATEAPAAGAQEKVLGKFYWVQNTAWHPVHQFTQQSFLEGCTELGLQCELATTDETSLEAFVAMAEQTVARDDAKGVAMWAGGLPVVKPIIEKAKEKGIWIALPHFPVPEGTFADNAVQIAADPTKYPDPAAKAMCDQLKGQKGSVAITINNHNATEDAVAKAFADSMTKYCPDIKILPVEEEGIEPTKAIAKGVSIMQANADLLGAFSTTGGGASTWAGAQKETGKKIIAIGVDATRVNLDLVKSGAVFAVVEQPLYTESKGSAELLYKMANGEKVPYWTVLDAPLITNGSPEMTNAYETLDRLEKAFRPTPTPKP
jgi:ribose transport system substrate-binding protein